MAGQQVICGSDGNATLANRGARIASWSADLLHGVNDATGFGSNWTQNKGGLKSLQGSASGWLTKGTANDQPGFNATSIPDCSDGELITLTASTGCNYTFTGQISRIQIGESVADNARVVFDFVSNGTVTETWDIT